MKSIIEKNAARIIITTLIALVIVGIVVGSHPSIPPNPGHGYNEIDGFDLLHILQGNSNAIGFTGTTILGGPLAIGTTNTTGLITLNAGAGGWDIGITQKQLGGAHTLELTTGDESGNQATRILIRGNDDTADIEFYGGASGTETLNMILYADTGNLNITGDICANAFGGSPTCLTSGGGSGGGQKICSAVKLLPGEIYSDGERWNSLKNKIAWIDSVMVPDSWTTTDCGDFSGGYGMPLFRLGCIFDSGSPKYSVGTMSNSVSGGPRLPSRNCGW